MEDQKLENLLNLALGATEEEREKSMNLDVGYHPIDREWELIIKYSGNLDQVRALAIQVVELQNEYAIIRISQSRIDLLSDIPEVEYIEKPKRLFFQIANGKRVSCINEVQDTRFLDLRGQGVLVAIIDSGIDYANEDFRNADGTTRIRVMWDQSLRPNADEEKNPPKGIGWEWNLPRSRLTGHLRLTRQRKGEEWYQVRIYPVMGLQLQGLLPEMGEEAEICMPVWHRRVS